MKKSAFGDGEWTASTLGHFISLLVDSRDEAILYRYVTSQEPDASGTYLEILEIALLPNGYIRKALAVCPSDTKAHKVLKALLEGGVVK